MHIHLQEIQNEHLYLIQKTYWSTPPMLRHFRLPCSHTGIRSKCTSRFERFPLIDYFPFRAMCAKGEVLHVEDMYISAILIENKYLKLSKIFMTFSSRLWKYIKSNVLRVQIICAEFACVVERTNVPLTRLLWKHLVFMSKCLRGGKCCWVFWG